MKRNRLHFLSSFESEALKKTHHPSKRELNAILQYQPIKNFLTVWRREDLRFKRFISLSAIRRKGLSFFAMMWMRARSILFGSPVFSTSGELAVRTISGWRLSRLIRV